MKKFLFWLFILSFLCSAMPGTGMQALAQKVSVIGKITEAATGEVLPGATALLLNTKDSTQVTGAASNVAGAFTLPAVKAGTYLLKVSHMGFRTDFRTVTLAKGKKNLDVGTIALEDDAKMMKEADVVARVAQVEMKADTFVFNADAYRLPEGSALEELVRKLPGAEVDENGKITINGKEIKKIMVGGKEFFNNDTKMAMKNLPTKMVNKIKSYERKSDYSRVTGIDDGEEEMVLDLTVKKGMKEGWLINADGAYGTKDRYSGKLTISRFMDNYQFTIIGSSNNVNDQGFPGGGGRWRGGGGGGVVSSQMAGVNFAWENGLPDYTAGLLKVGGNVRFSRSDSETISRTNSETYLPDGSSTWENSSRINNNINWNLNANFRFEWMPDSMTNIMLRPNFSHSDGRGNNTSLAATFDQNPFNYMQNPLEEYSDTINHPDYKDFIINDNKRTSKSNSVSNNFDANLQINRQLGRPGRNITLDVSGAYSNSTNESFNLSRITYPKTQKQRTFTNQYNNNPSTSHNVSTRLSYTEPLSSKLNLQGSYQFQYRFSDADRTMYSIDSLLTKFPQFYTEEQLYMGYLPGLDTLNMIKNWENSQYATYNEYNHNATLMARYNNKWDNGQELRINAGVTFQPQTTHMDYKKNMLDTTVVRNTFNWSPRVDVRWKISQTSQLRVRYNGRMSQPSMTNLLEVTDSSDPLNISTGNSGLRSSWNDNMNLFYNDYITEKQMGWSVWAMYSQTKNSISTATIYDNATGGRYTRPMNINGNWNANANLMFNTAIGSKKLFNVSNNINIGYSNNVGYMSSTMSEGFDISQFMEDGIVNMNRLFTYAEKNNLLQVATTKSTTISEYLRGNFRTDFGETGSVEVGLNGGFTYQHARNDMQPRGNMDTWTFNYGGNLILNMPWGMSFSTDIGPQYRRGYDDANMNTTEIIWNAQLSQSFLRDKALTISAQWFDILGERSNISRNISATMHSDTYTNAIHSYAMFHIIYKLNLVGNKEARAAMGPGGFGPGAGGPGGNRRGGPGGRF